ncbi:hypothetical protein KEM55_009213 [Ascosphaera atra]|nr:hypothetical protein KEM55_009213 [Ascosphaera atra]
MSMTSSPQEVQEVTGKFAQYLACMILGTGRLSNKANPFEGLLYHILEHAGKIMAQFAFRDLQQNPVMRIEGDKLPSPVAFVATSDEPMVSQRAAEWESQHIIWLLDEALALAARSTTKGRDAMAPLLAHEKLRLQNTLLHGIFGTEVQISQDCLALPAVPSPPKAYANERLDTSHWFTQELWKSVGWDVLLKKA